MESVWNIFLVVSIKINQSGCHVFQLRLFGNAKLNFSTGPIDFGKMAVPEEVIALTIIFIFAFVEQLDAKTASCENLSKMLL